MYIHAPTTPFRQIQLNWIEFEIDLNEFRVSFVCRFCSIQNMLKSNNMSNWSNFQRFDDHKLKSVNSISDMINAENKSATKHQNNAAFCLPSLFYFIYTVKIYEPIRQLERKAVFITEDRMKKKTVHWFSQSKREISDLPCLFLTVKQENQQDASKSSVD